jgi:NADH-quinone oxidoreductase subunit C
MANEEPTTGDARTGQLASVLTKHFAALGCEIVCALGEVTLTVPAERLLATAETLRDDPALRFSQLIDLCGVDYVAYGQAEWETIEASSSGFGRGVDPIEALAVDDPKRFAVVYHLLSIEDNRRLRMRVYAEGESGQPIVDSVREIWNVADWFEREAFDLYGILFRGHPDLRRILTDYGFVGHPFRKDFPLSGQVEMRYDPQQQRVVYQPVSIEPRVLVPKVIRADSRYVKDGETIAPQDAANA